MGGLVPVARGAILVVLAALVGGCATSVAPAPSARPDVAIPSLAPVALPGAALGFERATLLEPLVPRLGATPDGPEMRSQPDGIPEALDRGRRVVLLGDPQPGPGGEWVRVWVEPSLQVSPGDFYAWLPTARDGREVLGRIDPVACPELATIQTLAPLVQQDRLRCVGDREVTIDGRTGQLGAVPMYDVEPAWYGMNAAPAPTVLFDAGPIRFGPGAKTQPGGNGGWLDAKIPPGVAALPIGFFVRVSGHFDDPTAATCRRRIAGALPGQGPPVEAAVDSVQWCREQFVVSAWQALLGPEGRPIDLADPQLHRREFRPQPGVLLACGGVGMQPLTIRIDPGQIDPVWVESGKERSRSLAIFGDEFRLLLDPVRVQATTGVTLVDGEKVDPDRGKPGLAVCPGGETVWFDVPPP